MESKSGGIVSAATSNPDLRQPEHYMVLTRAEGIVNEGTLNLKTTEPKEHDRTRRSPIATQDQGRASAMRNLVDSLSHGSQHPSQRSGRTASSENGKRMKTRNQASTHQPNSLAQPGQQSGTSRHSPDKDKNEGSRIGADSRPVVSKLQPRKSGRINSEGPG